MALPTELYQQAVTAFAAQQWPEAESLLQQALILQPQEPHLYNALGNLQATLKNHLQAKHYYQQALHISPVIYLPALQNLVHTLLQLEEWDAALNVLQIHVVTAQDWPEREMWLGFIAEKCHQLPLAATAYKSYLAHHPANAVIHRLVGHIYQQQHLIPQALEHYHAALALQPDNQEVPFLLGTMLQQQGSLMAAIQIYEKMFQQEKWAALIGNNLGCCWRCLGYPAKATKYFEKALVNDTTHSPYVASNLLICLFSDPAVSRTKVDQAFMDWGTRFGTPFYPVAPVWPQSKQLDRPLKIGYLMPHFMYQSPLQTITPILLGHDTQAFHLYAYSDVTIADVHLNELKQHFTQWVNIAGWEDERVTAQIRTDQIDILVDLAGHMDGHRLLVFARKPAPLQVTGLTFPYTTGLATMDYILTDTVIAPPTDGPTFIEQVYPLSSFFHWSPPEHIQLEPERVAITESPYPTLGSANQSGKLNDTVLNWWCQILAAVPQARLRLKSMAFQEPMTREHFWNRFAQMGIAKERVDLLPPSVALSEHFQFYQTLDVALDPYPYTGAISTCDALWMGVPVVSLSGGGNMTPSILTASGFGSWVTPTPAAYMQRAIALMSQPQPSRSDIRQQFLNSAVCQVQQSTAELEQAYRWMWQQWCNQGD